MHVVSCTSKNAIPNTTAMPYEILTTSSNRLVLSTKIPATIAPTTPPTIIRAPQSPAKSYSKESAQVYNPHTNQTL